MKTQLPPPKGGTAPKFLVHLCCDQTVAHLSYCWTLVLVWVNTSRNLQCYNNVGLVKGRTSDQSSSNVLFRVKWKNEIKKQPADPGSSKRLVYAYINLELYFRIAAKTELLWCGSSRRIVQLPSDRVTICGSDIQPASVVRDLGVWIDSGVTVSTHIRLSKVVAGCFAILRQFAVYTDYWRRRHWFVPWSA